MFSIAKTNKILWWCVGGAVFLSLAHSFYFRIEPSVDARAYDNIGWNLVEGNGYVENSENAVTPELDNAIARVGPGYEFFLAGVYALFGHQIWIVWVLQALFRGLSVLLLYAIARSLAEGERGALFVAGFFAFSPDLTILSSMLLTETLGIFLLCAALYLSLRFFERQSFVGSVVLGVIWTAAFMTRTTFVVLFLVFVGIVLWRRQWRYGISMVAVSAALLAPWVVHNERVFHAFIPTNAVGGYDLWVGNNPGATGGFVKTPEIQAVRDETHIVELSRIGFAKYFEFMREEPLQFIRLQVEKASIYFSLLRPTGFWPYVSGHSLFQLFVVASSALWTALLFVAGIAGAMYIFLKNKSMANLFLLVCALLQPASVIPIIVESRYRLPFFPFLAIFAGAYMGSLMYGEKKERSRWILRAGIVLLALLFITGFDMRVHWQEFASHI